MNAVISIERAGETACLTFCDPGSHNGLTTANMPALRAAIEDAAADPAARFLVLASGHRNFCVGGSGAFIRELTDCSFAERLARIRAVQEVIVTLAAAPLFTLAAVDGLAAGAGVELALACDSIAAGPRARVSLLYAKLGLVPDCGTLLLARHLGAARASDALAQSPLWRQRELGDLGIAEALPALPESAAAWDKHLRRRYRFARDSFAETKRLTRRALLAALREELPLVAEAQARCLDLPDTRERVRRMAGLQDAS